MGRPRQLPVRFYTKWLLAGIALLLALYYAALFLTHKGDPDFLSIDSCLDDGGRWDYTNRVCVK
jgi:hypothetical protein